MTAPTQTRLVMTRGDSRTVTATLTLDAVAWTLLEGDVVTMTARRSYVAATSQFARTGTFTPGTATVSFALVPADTSGLPDQLTILPWDIQVVRSSSVWTVAQGTLAVYPDAGS